MRNAIVLLAPLWILVAAACGNAGEEPPPAEPDSVPATIELIEAATATAPDRDADALEVLVTERGEIRVGGEPRDASALKALLVEYADAERETDHPMLPSGRWVVIRADARAVWSAVRPVILACLDANVRLYRLALTAAIAPDGEPGVIPTVFPKDRGLSRTQSRLEERPRIVLSLYPAADGTGTRARLPVDTQEVPLDEAGLSWLGEQVAHIHEVAPDLPGEVHPADDVPFGDVVRALDLLRAAGVVDDFVRTETFGIE